MAQILGHNCVRLPPYAYEQHMNVLKHSVYVQYGRGKQFEVAVSLVGFVGCQRRQFRGQNVVSDDMLSTCHKMSAGHLATSASLAPFLALSMLCRFRELPTCQHVHT